jgi:thiamine kinase-like enzyme
VRGPRACVFARGTRRPSDRVCRGRQGGAQRAHSAQGRGDVWSLEHAPRGGGWGRARGWVLHHYSRREGKPRNELDAAISWLDAVEAKVPAKNLTLLKSLREQVAQADGCHDLPEALVHPDPVLKNLIATPDSKLVWIDWTGAGRGPRLASLALLIWSSALDKGGWSPQRVDAIVAGYRTHVQPQEKELSRLNAAMRIRPVVFACWRYRHAILTEKVPDGSEWWLPSCGVT